MTAATVEAAGLARPADRFAAAERRRAGWRLDRLLGLVVDLPRPEHFGLSRVELAREIDRCRSCGWQHWELRVRFVNPGSIPAEGWSS